MALELPSSLEPERAAYLQDIRSGRDDVVSFFRSFGVSVPPQGLIDSAIVFESTSAARESMARVFRVPVSSIPESFAGTVDGRRLFLVSREAYQATWRGLYSAWPWTDVTYHQLVVHELAHRAHEAMAISGGGTADAMGPTWFFEGLAVVCAGQFDDKRPLLARSDIEALVGSGRAPAVSYPLYGLLVRSLTAMFDLKVLLRRAAEPGFPQVLWSS